MTKAKLRALLDARTVLSADALRPLLGSKSRAKVKLALALAALSGDRSLAPQIAALHPKHTEAAAMALGELRAAEHAEALVARLPRKRFTTAAVFILVALERMRATHVIPALRAYITSAPADLLWDVHHALSVLTGAEPVLPLAAGTVEEQAAAIRGAWADAEVAPTPRVEPTAEGFVLHAGRGLIGLEYAPPIPGSSWPRFAKAVYLNGALLYHLQSDCDTCETTLRLAGFPEPFDAAAQMRGAVGDVAAVTPALLEALGPLVAKLRSGHYLVQLVDLPIERVDAPADSWLHRREELRVEPTRAEGAPAGMTFEDFLATFEDDGEPDTEEGDGEVDENDAAEGDGAYDDEEEYEDEEEDEDEDQEDDEDDEEDEEDEEDAEGHEAQPVDAADEAAPFEDDSTPVLPGTPHYQARAPLQLDPPTFGLLAPTQPITALREETVAHFTAALQGGAHPTAVALAWYERRAVSARFEEAVLVAAILDGHHKLEAAARAQVPARVLLLCRLEDTWGPPEDRAAWLRRAIAPFAVA